MNTRPAGLPLVLEGGVVGGIDSGPADQPPAILFAHANGLCAAAYRPLLVRLATRARVIAPDARGHGATTLPAVPRNLTSWTVYGHDLAHILEQVATPAHPVVLVGHSLGGSAAAQAAALHPQLVRALLLVDPAMAVHPLRSLAFLPAGPALFSRWLPLAAGARHRRREFPDRATARDAWRDRGLFRRWKPGFLEGYVEGGLVDSVRGVRLACDPEWEAATFAALRHEALDLLPKLTCPVHVLLAGQGSIVRKAPGHLRRHAPRAVWDVVEDASHMLPMEQPDLVHDRIVRLLRPGVAVQGLTVAAQL